MDTYNIGPTVPALFKAHEDRYQEAGKEIDRLKGALAANLKCQEQFAIRVLGEDHYGSSPCQAHPLQLVEEEIDKLRAELAECKRDAERYRWLRGDAPDHSGRWTQWEVRRWKAPMWTQDLRRDELDVAIDAAMKKEAGKEETK